MNLRMMIFFRVKDDTDGHLYQESISSEKAIKTHFKSEDDAKAFMNPFSDSDDDETDPHEKGSIFTNASNIRQRLKNAFVAFERDILAVGKMTREDRWTVNQCRAWYYENSYYTGSGWVVETSGPLARLRNVSAFVTKATKKKKCKSAFTKEELSILEDFGKKLKIFYTSVMGSHDFRSAVAKSHVEKSGEVAIEIVENTETYEKILGLRADNS